MTRLLRSIIESLGRATQICFRVTFPDGTSFQNRSGEPVAHLRYKTAGAQWNTICFGHVGMLESYFNQTLDFEGEFGRALQMAFESGFDRAGNPLVWLRNQWHEFRFGNRTIERAKANARFHYAIPAEFYAYWLDLPLLMYTCAYWKPGTRTVEEAQRNKIDHVCRKIRLQPGESVVDIGCGFGGFMLHAYENYRVKVCGVNTTTEQVQWVRQRIHQLALAEHLEVREADFREVHAQFDKVVSIGVLEHAGRDELKSVVQAHADFLKPGGLGMLHFIGHVGVRDTEFYIRKHVFPGGWIPSLAQTIEAMEQCGLEIVDIENLRRHYALTLDAWTERFDRNWDKIQALDPKRFDERFRRVWRTYLVSCAEMFRSAFTRTHLFQIVYSKGNINKDNYPMYRAFLYDEERGAQSIPSARETSSV